MATGSARKIFTKWIFYFLHFMPYGMIMVDSYLIEAKVDQVYLRIINSLREELQRAVDKSSQSEVAHICGTTPATIQRVLRGKRGENLPFRTVLTIALGLNLDIADLISPQPHDDKEKLKALVAEINKMIANQ